MKKMLIVVFGGAFFTKKNNLNSYWVGRIYVNFSRRITETKTRVNFTLLNAANAYCSTDRRIRSTRQRTEKNTYVEKPCTRNLFCGGCVWVVRFAPNHVHESIGSTAVIRFFFFPLTEQSGQQTDLWIVIKRDRFAITVVIESRFSSIFPGGVCPTR